MTQAVVHIIATGGTIAGVAASSTSRDYVAGSLSIQLMLASVPELSSLAKLTSEQLFNIDSVDMSHNHWLDLTKSIHAALSRPEVTGVVIAHGTDTLEETAYFLDLIHASSKPVVLVGSMRSASALSADGPMNLYNAIALTQDQQAQEQGVMVVMNDLVYSARQVTKLNTAGLDAFAAKDSQPLARVSFGSVRWFESTGLKTHQNRFNFVMSGNEKLPHVVLMTMHVGFDEGWLTTLIKSHPPAGLVLAGMGAGNLPTRLGPALTLAKESGIPVVRSTRVPNGAVTPHYNNLDQSFGLIQSGYLSAVKSRILLTLALLKTNEQAVLQHIFDQEGYSV